MESSYSAKIEAIVLAAGYSRRMDRGNKLTEPIKGKPLLCHMIDAVQASTIPGIVVVTGYEHNKISSMIANKNVKCIHNRRYREGLSTSLSSGIGALRSDSRGALILLGDMPDITSEMIEQMMKIFTIHCAKAIVQATNHGQAGHPVLWPRCYFRALSSLQGDIGARHLLHENRDKVVPAELGEAASLDLDTSQAFAIYNKTSA